MEEDRAAYIWVEEDRETGSLPPSKLATNQPRPRCGGSRGETKNREGFVAFEGWARRQRRDWLRVRPSGELPPSSRTVSQPGLGAPGFPWTQNLFLPPSFKFYSPDEFQSILLWQSLHFGSIDNPCSLEYVLMNSVFTNKDIDPLRK